MTLIYTKLGLEKHLCLNCDSAGFSGQLFTHIYVESDIMITVPYWSTNV